MGCKKEDDNLVTPKAVTTPPAVSLSCSGANHCANGSADGKRAKAYWFNSPCRDYGQSRWADFFKAGSTFASCSGGICTGTISSWPDTSSWRVMTPGKYSLLIFIDTDSSSSPTVGPGAAEPAACLENIDVQESTPTITMDSWFDYHF